MTTTTNVTQETILDPTSGDTLLGVQSSGFARFRQSATIIDLDQYGVSPGNSAATNQAAIANVMTKIRASTLKNVHVRLNRAGTFSIQKGTNGTQGTYDQYAKWYSCILLPSNCKFELSPETELKIPNGDNSYLIRNDNPIGGNTNIEICGGIYNNNNASGTMAIQVGTSGVQGWFGNAWLLENITGLNCHDVTFTDQHIWAVLPTKVYRAHFDRIHFDVCSRDGIHVVGPASDLFISRITGETDDNTIVLATCEASIYFNDNLVFATSTAGTKLRMAGSINRVSIDDCNFSNCDGPVAIFGSSSQEINDVTISRLRGTTSSQSASVISIGGYTAAGTNTPMNQVTIRDVSVVPYGNEPIVYIQNPSIANLTIDNVNVPGTAKGLVICGEEYDSVTIDNLHGNTTGNMLQFGDSSNSVPYASKSTQIGRIASHPASASSNPIINIQSNASWTGDMTISSIASSGTRNTGCIISAQTTRQKMAVDSANFIGGDVIFNGALDVTANLLAVHSQYEFANGAARVVANSIKINGTSKLLLSGKAMLNVKRHWLHIYIDYTDAQTAATAKSIALTSLPRGAIITATCILPIVAFSGGAINACTMRVRHGVSGATLSATKSVFSTETIAPVVTTVANSDGSFAYNVDPSFDIVGECSGANLSVLTAGQCLVMVEYMIAGKPA